MNDAGRYNCIKSVLAEIENGNFMVTDGTITRKNYMNYMRKHHPDKAKAQGTSPSEHFNHITGDCQNIIVDKTINQLKAMLKGYTCDYTETSKASPSTPPVSKCRPTDLCSTEGQDGECYPAMNVKSSLINPRLTSDLLSQYFDLMEARQLPGTSDSEYFMVDIRSVMGKNNRQSITSHPLETMGSLLWRFYNGTDPVQYSNCRPDYANYARIVMVYNPPDSALKPTLVSTGTDRDTCDRKWVDVAEMWKLKRIEEINNELSRFTKGDQQVKQQKEKGRMAAAAAMSRKIRLEKETAKYDLLVQELNYLTGDIHLPSMMKHVQATIHIVFPSSVLISKPEESLRHPNRSNAWTNSVLQFLGKQ